MSLEEIYYISQILSTAALVASLVYLGVQTRQAGKNQIAQMNQARGELFHEYTLRLLDPEFSPLAQAAFRADPDLSDEQIHRFYYFASTVLRFFEEIYREWREGMLGNDRWETTQRTMRGILRAPGYRASYKVLRGNLDPGIVTLMDSMIRDDRDSPGIDPIAEWRTAAAEELGRSAAKPNAV